ncbi:MAG: multidrug efflux RND transporter permease subunit [Syntrophobacterales bacterium]|jgi:multidrug efflux pump|nr:multidrug efflux RND transporter permease subunit [Syntrophobacterales bacterium]
MNISAAFIKRPVATTLLTVGLALAGILAFHFLPVSPLPQVDFPTIQVSASLPGAQPETMATSVAAPLERQFGRIAGVTEMTSSSYRGVTSIVLQFELSRNINGAARDVQAAINAAESYLPPSLPSLPTYRKVNPADAPILILALTSDISTRAVMYDAASTILQQKISQVDGVGTVFVGGGSLPAVRVELNPNTVHKYGIGLEDMRGLLASTNVNRPKGQLADAAHSREIRTNDQLFKAEQYRDLIVAFRNGAPIRLADLGEVQDSVEDVRTEGLLNGKTAVMVVIFRAPGANIIDTVDRIRGLLPQLKASIPQNINLSVTVDRSPPIRKSLQDVERTLVLSGTLVILVVFAFLRNVRATLIPAVAVPVSLISTFGVMYLCGYSLDNLSLMALTIATGFVVDDAIVVIENITRYIEKGMPPLQAAFRGAREITFTVLSMSASLVAVFIPLLLMGGMVGRLFREFSVTLSAAILVSLVVSLTTTPMMCAALLRPEKEGQAHGILFKASEKGFELLRHTYDISLRWALRHPRFMLSLVLLTLAVNIGLFMYIPKGFFPEQDIGRVTGTIQASQDISFQAMRRKLLEVVNVIKKDPDVIDVLGFSGGPGGGGSTTNTARMFVSLKPFEERKSTARQVIARLRRNLSQIAGAPTYLQPVQDLRIGGFASAALYQFTLRGENLEELNTWGPRVLQKMRTLPELVDVNSNQQDKGLQSSLVIDRDTASRFGLTAQSIDDTLYDAFGQRQVSITYTPLNQYHVVMEVAPPYWQRPETLRQIYVHSPRGFEVPLSAFTRYQPTATPLSVNHLGQFPAVTTSFNLARGYALGDAVEAIEAATREMGLPASIRGNFMGTAEAFKASLANEPYLILAALLAVYIVLGILYESYVHPITILSTLPSAGVGALVTLIICGMDLSIIAVIGIILLIGIVKKNGIMMVDFALEVERHEGKSSREAIYEACLLRFRPIMMTTMAALLGALPLALGTGVGSELRRPLGISIAGGLVFSQMMTLYTTPVIYLYLDRFRLWVNRLRRAPGPVKNGSEIGVP